MINDDDEVVEEIRQRHGQARKELKPNCPNELHGKIPEQMSEIPVLRKYKTWKKSRQMALIFNLFQFDEFSYASIICLGSPVFSPKNFVKRHR